MSMTSAALTELRAALSPSLRTHIEDLESRTLLQVFTLLRHLRPGDVHTALLCHRVLQRQARAELAEYGFIDPDWAGLLLLVHNVLAEEWYAYHDGRWALDPERADHAKRIRQLREPIAPLQLA